MRRPPIHRYRPFPSVELPDRRWPARRITAPPVWCSVDLRDGNQALVEPMGHERKLRFFRHLVAVGFKEIEVGFPAASDTDFDFVRHIVERDEIPGDVTIQVLTQARPEQVHRAVDAVRGARRAIIHVYNSTSELQRRVVFGLDRAGVIDVAVRAVELVAALRPELEASGTALRLEYSPESFTGTELDFARDICHAVMDAWQPTPDDPIVLNLPATVEMASPNVYADQIEWMSRNLRNRDAVVLSLHPHNDRGCAVAAAELGLLAGADRIEGTLFGNGERTGNVDVVTLALNLLSHGVDPQLDFSDIGASVAVAEACNRLPVPARHPYAGELVYTAFSGSHQDAIKKGLAALDPDGPWEVPYLPIDPRDVGRSYEAIIRVNSQSGKGGIAYLLETAYGVELPREVQVEFAKVVQHVTDTSGKEMTSLEIWNAFRAAYLEAPGPLELLEHQLEETDAAVKCRARLRVGAEEVEVAGEGNGPIDGFVDALRGCDAVGAFRFLGYHQNALGGGPDARAACFVRLATPDGVERCGAGIHANTNVASLRAIVSALNRLHAGAERA